MPINLIKNGGFESNAVQGTFIMYTAPEHWEVEYGIGPDIITSDKSRNFFAPSGSDGNYVELDGSGAKSVSNSSISQAVSTTAGKTYALEFDWSPYPGFLSEFSGYDIGLPYLTDQFEVTINGMPVYRYEGTRQIQPISWRRNRIIFTADSSSTLIAFRADQGQGDFGGAKIDNVSLIELAAIRGNSLYTIVDSQSWTQAEAISVRLGGNLLTVNDKSEEDFIYKTFRNDLPTSPMGGLWIGLTDQDQEGVYKWSSGTPATWFETTYRGLGGWIANADSASQDYMIMRGNLESGNGYDWDDFWVSNMPWVGNMVNQGIAEIPFIRRGDSAYVIVQGPTWEDAEAVTVQGPSPPRRCRSIPTR